MFDLQNAKAIFDECISFFKQDISTLRTGRATPSLVEHIAIEAYGAKTPLMHVASITVSDAKTIIIQPWDKGIIKDIEKALNLSELHIPPVVDGTTIRLSMPALSEENRLAMVKLLGQKSEACKVSIRQQREKLRAQISREEEEGTISEDQKFKSQKSLDDLVKEYTDVVKTIVTAKETEIMSI